MGTEVDLVQLFKALEINNANEGTLCFISHHKKDAEKDARFLKDKLCNVLQISHNPDLIFLDSDFNGLSLNDLLHHVRRTRVLVLLQTADTLIRPYVIGEVVTAIQEGIPIVPVVIRNGGYNFASAAAFLSTPDFRAALERDTPGCVEVLEKQGFDLNQAGMLLREAIPQLISIELDLATSARKIQATVEDIAEAILKSKRKEKIKTLSVHAAESPLLQEYYKAEVVNDLKKMTRLASMDKGILEKYVNFVVERCKHEQDDVVDAQFTANQMQLRNAGSCEIINEALEEFGLIDATVTAKALVAMHCLSRDEENRKRLGTTSSCENVVKALGKWGENEKEIAERGCSAIRNLAVNDENRNKLGTFGACDIVSKVLLKWGEKEPVVAEDGCGAVANLSIDDNNRDRFRDSGTCDIVVKVLLKWGASEKDIAESGCRAIINLSQSSANRDTLKENGGITMRRKLVEQWQFSF
jgi:hypothetical protein